VRSRRPGRWSRRSRRLREDYPIAVWFMGEYKRV
jgi:hypothetical protein